MRSGFDEQDSMDQGFGSQGNGTAAFATPPSREHFGGTSSFSTIGLSDDGRFLGIKVSQDLASQLRTFYPVLLDWARRKGEKHGIPLAEKFATKVLDYKPADVKKFGGKAGNVIGYGIILSNQLMDIGRNVYDSMHSLRDLRTAVRPLEHSAGASVLSGNNEVVANAREKINGVFWTRLMNTATGAIATAPTLMTKWNEQKHSIEERKLEHALEGAKKDPDKIADVLQNKVAVGGVMDVDAANMKAGVAKLIERERAAYKSRMDAFVKEHKPAVEKEIQEAIKGITAENLRSRIRTLDYLGIETEVLENALKNRWNQKLQRYTRPDDKEIQEYITIFERDMSNSFGHYADDAVKRRFVRQNDPFDDEQAYLLGDERSRGTIKSQIEKKIHDLQEAHEKKKHEPQDPNSVGTMAASLGAGFVAEMTTNSLGGKKVEKYQQPVALDLILHLRRELEKAGDTCPDMVPGYHLGKRNDQDMGYARFVHKIFQEHQQDCKRAAIGNRFTEHLSEARWDDAAIQAMPDDQLNAYEYAIKTISKRIKDGRMDAIALVGLVGDKQKKIVRDDGRSFGPRGAGKGDKAQKEAILKIIDEQTIMVHSAVKQTDEKIHEKLGDLVFSVDDLKKAFTSHDMDPQQRSFIFTVISNIVGDDDKLGHMLGLTADQTKALRAERAANFNQLMDGAVSTLADMIEQQPEVLEQKLKLTAQEKDMIRGLAGRMHAEGKDVADLAANREEVQQLETTVANATMALDNANPKGFWAKLVSAAKTPKPTLSKATLASHDIAVDEKGQMVATPQRALSETDGGLSAQAREDTRRANMNSEQETVSRS